MKPLTHRIGEKLTAAEREKLLVQLFEARLEHTRLKEEKRDADRSYNERLNVLDDKVQLLAESARDNKNYRDVDVRHEVDDEKYEITIYRLDDGRKVETRPMDEDEREEAQKRRAHLHKNPRLPFSDVKVGARDATPAPKELEHNGQRLKLVPRGGGKRGGKGRAKKGEANP
jgi:hypothetical protein